MTGWGAAGAATPSRGGLPRGITTAAVPPITPGLGYVLLDGLAFVPDDPAPRELEFGGSFYGAAPRPPPGGRTLFGANNSELRADPARPEAGCARPP